MNKYIIVITTGAVIAVGAYLLWLYKKQAWNKKMKRKYRNTHENNIIQKNILQIYLPDKSKLHPSLKQNADNIQRQNPDWKYHLYDEVDIAKYLAEKNPELVSLYNSINPEYCSARSDFFRYLFMKNEGGLYLDIKSCMVFPLSNVIKTNDEFITGFWGKSRDIFGGKGEYPNWVLIGRKNHSVFVETMDTLIHNLIVYKFNPLDKFSYGKFGCLALTGPYPYTDAINKIMKNRKKYDKIRIINNLEEVARFCCLKDTNYKKTYECPNYVHLKTPLII